MENYKIIGDKHCFSTGLLIETFSINKSTLSRWEIDGCPKAAKGYWCIADVLRWRGMVGN